MQKRATKARPSQAPALNGSRALTRPPLTRPRQAECVKPELESIFDLFIFPGEHPSSKSPLPKGDFHRPSPFLPVPAGARSGAAQAALGYNLPAAFAPWLSDAPVTPVTTINLPALVPGPVLAADLRSPGARILQKSCFSRRKDAGSAALRPARSSRGKPPLAAARRKISADSPTSSHPQHAAPPAKINSGYLSALVYLFGSASQAHFSLPAEKKKEKEKKKILLSNRRLESLLETARWVQDPPPRLAAWV